MIHTVQRKISILLHTRCWVISVNNARCGRDACAWPLSLRAHCSDPLTDHRNDRDLSSMNHYQHVLCVACFSTIRTSNRGGSSLHVRCYQYSWLWCCCDQGWCFTGFVRYFLNLISLCPVALIWYGPGSGHAHGDAGKLCLRNTN